MKLNRTVAVLGSCPAPAESVFASPFARPGTQRKRNVLGLLPQPQALESGLPCAQELTYLSPQPKARFRQVACIM